MTKTTVAISIVVLLGGTALIILPRPTQEIQLTSGVSAKPILQSPTVEASALSGPSESMAKIFETHERVIDYFVRVPVYETHTKNVHYTVNRPQTETRVKEVAYRVIRTVVEEHPVAGNGGTGDRIVKTVKQIPESKVKPVMYTVCKMVAEQKTKAVTYTTCRMVTEARQKTVQYTTCRFVPAGTLQHELDQANERAIDPLGSNRCLN
jgi:hypothetical protein